MTSQKIFSRPATLIFLAVILCGQLLTAVSALPAHQREEAASGALKDGRINQTKADEEDDDGWSVTTWVIVIAACIVGFIVLSCLISYMFCACAKEIICLPFTCLGKILCCCCKD